jgi:uncharacterized protein (TIGR03435 family)
MNLMLQSLLAERFKLRVRWDARSTQVFALRRITPEQPGRNLKRLDVTCPDSHPEVVSAAPEGCSTVIRTANGQVKGVAPSMADIARFVGTFAGRRVVDDTGLAGPFELSMTFNPRSEGAGPLPAQEHLPSLRDSLRHDLGLELEPDRRDIQTLIVEHVEQPGEN